MCVYVIQPTKIDKLNEFGGLLYVTQSIKNDINFIQAFTFKFLFIQKKFVG